jgi:tRNA 2-selenouridine synthase
MLNEIGWRAVQLDGGYRAYRRHVVARLQDLPERFHYRVVCGMTGSGKSRLIAALAVEGAQALDLEALARHRGSVLGELPGDPQPSQKAFESELLAALERFDPARPVYVEAESRRIGTLQLPDSVLAALRGAQCILVATPQPIRVALLKEEYAHFLGDHSALAARFARLVPLHGKATIERWVAAAASGDWDDLVGELLARHYDPMYKRAIARNFPGIADAIVVAPSAVSDTAFRALAREVDAQMLAERAA